MWQADLVEMIPYATSNDGVNYLLTVIDVFSHKAWARPIKHKIGQEVKQAFESLFQETQGQLPNKLQTDQGKEFENVTFQSFLKHNNIHFFTIKSQFKTALAE